MKCGHVQNSQTHGDRGQMSCCQGLGQAAGVGLLGGKKFLLKLTVRGLHNLVHKLKTIAFYFFFTTLCGLYDLNSPARDEPWAQDHQGTPLNCPFQMSELQGM